MNGDRFGPRRRMAQLHALCQADLATADFLQAFLEALHAVIPSQRNLFDLTDSQGQLLHYYCEGLIDTRIAQIYFEHFHNRREAECMPAFATLASAPAGVRSARPLMSREFFHSALYNEIWRPQGFHSRVEGVVRATDGRLLGSLVLYRGPSDPDFSSGDEQTLATILPWIASALVRAETREVGRAQRFLPTPQREEYLLLSEAGQLRAASEGALGLLLQADAGLTLNGLRDGELGIRWALDRLFQRISLTPGDRSQPLLGAGESFRAVTLINAHGRFVVEVRSLQSGQGGAERLHQVCLRRHEPQTVSLHRALRQLPLTAGQFQVCRALYEGQTLVDLARQQRVAHSTVVDHTRKIYRALDVSGVGELRQLIDDAMRP
ncbi:DNA-binding CsgD family transcriptional regulator [Inhella inkyongensis]|uniref:DNA-binding CsgD family transcriptional regulator n=1 Tax=Inhella inkyongensis TaxID=392593 RepID=A0A840S3D0_9BURK|nr:hypothetical protein [Inhella inkyongensis]MBB5204835.1 DNA-binding CsgD family transcriptional regulator [Inhella inkyongensis]